jgi:DNA modification methylase
MIFLSNQSCIGADIGAYDHVITDPPYSMKVHRKASTMRGGKAQRNDLGFSHLSPELRDTIAGLAKRATSWSVIFSDWEGTGGWQEAFSEHRLELVRVIPWVRWSMPQLSGDRPPQGSEAVLLAHPGGRKSWNGPGNFTHFDHPAMRARGSGKHPTQKPLDLMLTIVSHYTEEGAVILDPCSGSGTTLAAARYLERCGVGYETQAEWHQRAVERIERLDAGTPIEIDRKHIERFEARHRAEQEHKARCKTHTAKVLATRGLKKAPG